MGHAHFTELIPLDSLDMVPKSMRLLAQREADSERRAKKRSTSSGNDWPEFDYWKGKNGKPWVPKGKGKGKYGKDGKDGRVPRARRTARPRTAAGGKRFG